MKATTHSACQEASDYLPHWFASNPDRAWAEKFFLLYSPVWMTLMALMMLTGWTTSSSDTQLLVHATLVAAPLFIIPALLHRRYSPQLAWHESYWFKSNLYIFIFGFFGNYFGSEYFFDVLGMVYNLPNATTALDAYLVGQSQQPVPLIMYFYTHAYFMTYHASAIVVLRRIMSSGMPLRQFTFMPTVFFIGYAWAWLETRTMANPLMVNTFYYEKMDAMLAYGSIIYSTYFIASFPIYYFLDENVHKRWSLAQTAAAGLSASMLTFFLLDFCAHGVGRL